MMRPALRDARMLDMVPLRGKRAGKMQGMNGGCESNARGGMLLPWGIMTEASGIRVMQNACMGIEEANLMIK